MILFHSTKLLLKNLNEKLRNNFIFVSIFLIFNAVVESCLIIVTSKFLNIISTDNINSQLIDKNSLINERIFWGLIFIVVILLANSSRIVSLRLSTKLSARIGKEFAEESLRTYLYKPFEWYLSKNNSDIIATLVTHSNRSVLCANQILQIILSIFISSSLFISILIINPKIALFIIFTLIFAYFIFTKLFNSKLTNTSEIIGKNTKLLVKSINESLGNIRDIKIDNYQDQCAQEFSNLDKKCRFSLADSLFWAASPRFIIEALALSAIGLLTIFYFENSIIQIGSLGAILLASQRLIPTIQLGYSSWAGIKVNSKSLVIITSSIDKMITQNVTNIKKEQINYDEIQYIELKGLQYKYPSSKNLIKYKNFKIYKGDKIAILGKSGSGKSTLLDLLIGFLTPTKGNINLKKTNGKELSNISLYKLINIGHISQSIYLSDKSILENIAFGQIKNKISYDNIIKASKVSDLYNFINELPNKFNTIVGDKGDSLSGGQKQRLSLARALYKSSQILFLDEPTSSLDDFTGKKVINRLIKSNKNATIIMITHNKKLAELFDRNIILD